ncbi:MAG: hypothetical protein OXC61_02115 [Flavobacteriaceae bacterium]|nr:hypothetical protein [Flavobacteriaceae bacterium]
MNDGLPNFDLKMPIGHQSKDFKISENMAFIEQPTDCPELNPVEQIWQEVEEKFLYNQWFETLEDLKE